MLTFTQNYTEVYQGAGIPSTDSTNISLIKRNINTGVKRFKSAAFQYYNRKEKTANLIAGQQYYTLDVDSIRPTNIRINNGSLIFPIPSVESEMEWNALNIIPQFAVFYPQRWFVRGNNEIGVWPIPSTNISSAMIVAYDARYSDMYLDDTVGLNITVTNGSNVITCATSSFTANMVGMYLTFTDGSDGQWYKIIGYTNGTTMAIENYYQNTTQTNASTLIGSVPDVPEEYHPAFQDYAFYRYYKTQRGQAARANDFLNDFTLAREEYVGTFGDKEASQVIKPKANFLAYNPLLVPPVNL
jgi:hypothetical protein